MHLNWHGNLASWISRGLARRPGDSGRPVRSVHMEHLAGLLGPAIRTWTGPISSSWSIIWLAEGYFFSGVLAAFTIPRTLAVPGKLTAKVDWGDGKVSAAAVAFDPVTNRCTVTGRHTYVRTGSVTVTATITDGGGSHSAGRSLVVVLSDVTVGDNTVLAFGSPQSGSAELSLRRPAEDSS
jgi:hypothetical protein